MTLVGSTFEYSVHVLQFCVCRIFCFPSKVLTKRPDIFLLDLKVGPKLCLWEFVESSASAWPRVAFIWGRTRTATVALLSRPLRRRAGPVSRGREESETVPRTVSPSRPAGHLTQHLRSRQGLPLVCCRQGKRPCGPQPARALEIVG